MKQWWKKIMASAVVVAIVGVVAIVVTKYMKANINRYQAEEEIHLKELDSIHLKEEQRKIEVAKRVKEIEDQDVAEIITNWKARFES